MMRTTLVLAATGLLVLAGAAAGQRGAKTAASAPASAAAIDPAAMKLLQRLEAAGKKFPNITANIDYVVDLVQAGDKERRTGKVYYQAADPTKNRPACFRIHFDTLSQSGGPRIKNVVDYVFDGAWLTVRKERIKQLIRYQVAPPGKKIEPLQLGKGPFPVPFGQKARRVTEYFKVTTRQPRKGDPPKTDYLRLVTRKRHQRELTVRWLQMWVSTDTALPVKIIAGDRSQNVSTVAFDKIETPKSFPKDTFDLPTPGRDWDVRVELYRGHVR